LRNSGDVKSSKVRDFFYRLIDDFIVRLSFLLPMATENDCRMANVSQHHWSVNSNVVFDVA
jgi:hypothetical protein